MLYPDKTLHMIPSCLGGSCSLKTLWVAWYLPYLLEGTSGTAKAVLVKQDILFKRQPLQL